MYKSSVKLLLKFENSSLLNSINFEEMTVQGEDLKVDILPSGLGYVMKDDQYLEGLSAFSGISDGFTLSFWLYPVSPGIAINPETDETSSIQMPLLDFVENGSSVFSISEQTNEDSTNYLNIKLGDSYQADTSSYKSGLWHHIFVVFDGDRDPSISLNPSLGDFSFKIYIDGELQSLSNISGEIPSEIGSNVLDLYINRHFGDYDYNITNNYGFIDDIMISNYEIGSEDDLQKIINYGIDYVVDDIYKDIKEEDYALFFDDPTTITINSVIDDMSYVYFARNDGKILRGSPLFWETRRVFDSYKEKNILNESIIGDGTSSEINNGFLKIRQSVFRF